MGAFGTSARPQLLSPAAAAMAAVSAVAPPVADQGASSSSRKVKSRGHQRLCAAWQLEGLVTGLEGFCVRLWQRQRSGHRHQLVHL
jgi:hypothetical protein